MTGVEIDFVVKDSVAALELYKKFLEVEVIEATDLEKGTNEAVFTVYGTRFHMLDENPQYGLNAPSEDSNGSMWINVLTEDIRSTFKKALDAGCSVIQELTELPDFGVSNAVIKDPFGYVWMFHEIQRIVSFEERVEHFRNEEEKMKKEGNE